MKNSEQPITPTLLRQVGQNEYRVASEKDSREGQFLSSHLGLTKREYFAGLALSSGKSAKESVSLADELLIELENEQFKKTNG
jgi:hypothetical protein